MKRNDAIDSRCAEPSEFAQFLTVEAFCGEPGALDQFKRYGMDLAFRLDSSAESAKMPAFSVTAQERFG